MFNIQQEKALETW